MEKKWTLDQLEKHIRLNVEDYGSIIVVGALFHRIYGRYPKAGLSGFQAQAIESLLKVLPPGLEQSNPARKKTNDVWENHLPLAKS